MSAPACLYIIHYMLSESPIDSITRPVGIRFMAVYLMGIRQRDKVKDQYPWYIVSKCKYTGLCA